MKEHHVLFLIVSLFMLTSFQSKPDIRPQDILPGFQRENTVSTWGCWVDGTFGRITVIRGEVFTATLQTRSFDTLILHGSEKVDSRGNPVTIIGSIERKEDGKAIGTFYVEKIIPATDDYPENSLRGNLHLIDPKTDLMLIFSPNQ